MTSSLTEQLLETVHRPVSHDARQRAARHVADWLGTVFAGARTPEGASLITATRAMGGAGACRVVGLGSCDPTTSAFVHGGLAITLELDDLHLGALLHPGDSVIPAALAAAESVDAPAEVFLDAVVRGYEAAIRVGESVGDGHYRLWHNTSTCGPFGAAVAVCSILDLPQERWVDALGNAGTQASGFWQCREEKTGSKVIHSGRSASSGLIAAYLAREGLSGPRFILEGPMGFYAATCPDPHPEALTTAGESDWKIEEVALKRWAVCGHVIPTIDASLELSNQLRPDLVERALVTTYQDALVFADCPAPESDLQMKFSLQHGVAVGLMGAPTLEQFEREGGSRPELADLRRRVEVVLGTSPEGQPGSAPWGAEVEISTVDGRKIKAFCSHPKGARENPLNEAEVRAKFMSLTRWAGLDGEHAGELFDTALGLMRGKGVRDLTSLFAVGAEAEDDSREPSLGLG